MSKAFDIRLYWIKDRINKKESHIYWYAGAENFADYFTKRFSPTYHKATRPTYTLKSSRMNTTELQCEGVLIYQDNPPWGDPYMRYHIKILPSGAILI